MTVSRIPHYLSVLCFYFITFHTCAIDYPLSMAQAHSKHIRGELLKLATMEDNAKLYSIIETTRFTFSAEMDATEVAFSSIDDGRLISISNAYLINLAGFIETQLESDQSHKIFMHAFSDVLLHELGHHALDAFYNDYTPPTYISMYEKYAQEWAEQIKHSIDQDVDGIGRIVSLTALLDHSMSHPELAWQRASLSHKVDTQCDLIDHEVATHICTVLIQDGVYLAKN